MEKWFWLILFAFSIIMPQPADLEAKIWVKDKNAKAIIIKKGDTLWDLSNEYYNNPVLWPNFKKYNVFTNPHWIYPGEKLAIGYADAKKLDNVLQTRISSLVDEKKDKIKKIINIKEEMMELQEKAAQEEKDVSALISQKEEELYRLQAELEKKDEECKMLANAISELQIKLAELEATVDAQRQEITQLQKQNNFAKGVSYFIGFAVVSGVIASEVVK
jgi:LysM repeat protein